MLHVFLHCEVILDETGKVKEEKKEKLPAPTYQLMVDGIEYTWRAMCCMFSCIVKSFFVQEFRTLMACGRPEIKAVLR